MAALTAQGRALLDRWIYVLVLANGEFSVPYTEARRHAVLAGEQYGADFEPFLERFLATLEAPEWPPGNYFPGGWYRALKAKAGELPAAPPSPANLGPFFGAEVRVDSAGRWAVGPKAVSGRVLEFFLRHLEFDGELGRYRIRYWLGTYPETRYVRHESPPFRVRAVRLEGGPPRVLLNDGTEEPLRPETLRLNAAEALFCAVKPQGLPAVFDSGARFDLLHRVDERQAGWWLHLPGGDHELGLHRPWSGSDQLPGGSDQLPGGSDQ
jgi:hypothetical protein